MVTCINSHIEMMLFFIIINAEWYYKDIERDKRWVRKTDFFSSVQLDTLWIKTGKIKQFRVSCSWAIAESSLAAALAVTITLISHRRPLFRSRTSLCSLWTFINVTVLLWEKCMYLSVRGNMKRGYVSERERGKEIKWGRRGNDKVCWITGWHWKKPLCPFSLHLSIPWFTLCALFTSHTSSISTYWLSPISIFPHQWGSPSHPVALHEYLSALGSVKHFPKVGVNEIIVLRHSGVQEDGLGRGEEKECGMKMKGELTGIGREWDDSEEGRELENRRGWKEGRRRKTAMADRKDDKSSKEKNKDGIKIKTNGGKERWEDERRERRGNEEKMMNN